MAILNNHSEKRDAAVKHNIKASYVTINFTRPALLALKYDFQELKFDTKQERKLNKDFIDLLSNTVNVLSKARRPIEHAMKHYGMSDNLSHKADQLLDIVYDIASMNHEEVDKLKLAISEIKNSRDDSR